MNIKRSLFAGLLAIPTFFMTGSLQAEAVTGSANIAGNVNVSANSIIFSPQFTTTNGASETGSFAGLTGGTIMSLFNGPSTGDTLVPGFIMFDAGLSAPINFDLTYIAPGVGTQEACGSSTPGAVCTPANSPFTLMQLTSNTVIATLQMNGTAYSGSPLTGTSSARGIFSTQTVLDGTIPSVVSSLLNGGTLTGITYSASFAATPNVPEPASMLLMGLGLVGAGVAARRKIAVK